MNGVNSILFQPISIYKPYLYSFIAQFLSEQKMNVSGGLESKETKYIQNIQAQVDSSEKNKTNPVVINVVGPIVKYSSWRVIGTSTISNIIKRLDNENSISHIILNIDSGGGMVSGTTHLSETIKNCKKKTIAYTNGYACSAAQQIFSSADVGVVDPHADLMGSIGTYISYQDFSKMFEKYGAKIMELYAPQSTEKNKAFRDWEGGDEKEMLKNLENHAGDFINIMKSYRGDKLKDDGGLFKGKTYRPKEAVEVGLADHMMTFEELINNI